MTTTTTAKPTAETVARTLADNPSGITVRDLAEAAGIGASTASKALTAMQAAGTATRTPGPTDGNRQERRHLAPGHRRRQPSRHGGPDPGGQQPGRRQRDRHDGPDPGRRQPGRRDPGGRGGPDPGR